MARKGRKVRLPMETWHMLSRKLDPEPFCTVLTALRADGQTWAAVAARAVGNWKYCDALFRKQFVAREPMADKWSRLAYLLAVRRIPLRASVVRDIRRILIATGSVAELVDLDFKYGKPPIGAELRELTDAVYDSGLRKYDWEKWSALVEVACRVSPGAVAEYVKGKHRGAVSDHNFDG